MSRRRGDKVRTKVGSLKDINGVFDRTIKDKNREMIFMAAINYQARVVVERLGPTAGSCCLSNQK